MEVLHASVALVIPSPGKDDGGVMRIMRPGVSVFAVIRAETRVERDVAPSNDDRGMRREARARFWPTFYKHYQRLSQQQKNSGSGPTATSEAAKTWKKEPKLGNVVTTKLAPSTFASSNPCPN